MLIGAWPDRAFPDRAFPNWGWPGFPLLPPPIIIIGLHLQNREFKLYLTGPRSDIMIVDARDYTNTVQRRNMNLGLEDREFGMILDKQDDD